MLNHITLMGRLTRDPELRYTSSNTPVASFTLAVDRDYAPRDGGERQTDFIDIVAWRQTGEFVSKYFTKGQLAVVSGRLQLRDWTDRDGNKRRSAEVVAENVYFGESKKSRENSDGGYRSAPQESYGTRDSYSASQESYSRGGGYSAPQSQPSAFAELDDGDDGDLPF